MSDLHRMLFDSAEAVLETMFFTGVTGDAEPVASSSPAISARLSFHGNPSGSFGVSVPLGTGRTIAASFLGVEEEALTESQIGEVVCELANMLCGSVLSRLESKTGFELVHPELDLGETSWRQDASVVSRAFELDAGTLEVWARLEPPR